MINKITKNFILLLLAASMVLSGICFGSLKSYSDFPYDFYHETIPSIDLQNGITSSPKLCTYEMLGHNTTLASIKENRSIPDIKGLGTAVFLLDNLTLFENSTLFYMPDSAVLNCKSCSIRVIVRYIHNLDGKKA